MPLPIPTDYEPMEAESAQKLPTGATWLYEPKWDGFRCLVFRDGDRVELRSKAGKPLGRYFPDVVEAMAALDADRFVLDGEIVIPVEGRLSFDELLLRIHPAESRVRKLVEAHPAVFIAFDLLVDADGIDLTGQPLEARRSALEAFAAAHLDGRARLMLSPSTDDVGTAREWLEGGRLGLDGVMAKRAERPYDSGGRKAMKKIKRMRTADCVIGGFRWAKAGDLVGSILLGLYAEDGRLHHVGFCSAMNAKLRAEVTAKVVPLRGGEGFDGRAPGGPSRWRREGSGEWEPVRPDLVVEVEYDHFTGGRFRHGTKFLRWRPDKEPEMCRMEQVEKEGANAMEMI